MNFLKRLFGQEEKSDTETQAAPDADEVKPPETEVASEKVESPDETREDLPVDMPEVDQDPYATQPKPDRNLSVWLQQGGRPQGAIETAPLAPGEGDMAAGTRQLPTMEEVEAFVRASMAFGYAIDVGQMRSNNQDALVAYAVALRTHNKEIDFGLFGVADGMGGHLDGEKASALLTTMVTERVLSEIYLELLRLPADEDAAESVPVAQVLMESLQEANRTILEDVPGSGTTATFAVTIGNMAYIAHIGDSRAYMVTGQTIEQITRDHSLAQRLFEVGQLTREEMGSFPRRNELYKVIGFTEDMEPDLNTRRLPPGSYLLICSDGLWGEVPEIILQDVVITAPTPHAACTRLIDLANERGGHDNISVVVVQIPTTVSAPPAPEA